MTKFRGRWLALAAALALSACGEEAKLPIEAGQGADPQLPPPASSLIPTVNIAEAVGWPQGARPVPAPGLAVSLYAGGLDHPRWLNVLPNGDLLVAEANAPPRPESEASIKGWIVGLFRD